MSKENNIVIVDKKIKNLFFCSVLPTLPSPHKEGKELDLTVADGILGEIRG